MSSRKPLVIVVGAGVSGLSAATLLNNNDIDVVVLEASARVGGRLYTQQNDKVGYVDLGGAYVGHEHTELGKLLDALGLQLTPVYSSGESLRYTEGRIDRYSIDKPMMERGIRNKLDAMHLTRSLDALCKEVSLANPWETPRAEYLDRMTLQEWLDKTVTNSSVQANIKMLARSNFCAEPHEVSLLWALWDMKTAGGLTEMNTAGDGAQEYTIIGGSQQVPQKLAERLGDKVLLNKPVSSIFYDVDKVVVTTLDKYRFEADYVILAVPPSAQQRIVFTPTLPSLRNQLISRMPMGSIIKVFMYYDRPYWREKGLTGELIIEDDDLNHPVVATMDDTKPDGSYPCIMGFVGGDKARVPGMTKEKRCKQIAQQYAKMFQCQEMAKPVHYEEMDWSADPWAGGGYAGIMTPGVLTGFGRALRKPIGRLHFAGTEAGSAWPGYIEGGIRSGYRASREILYLCGKCNEDEIDPDTKTVKLSDQKIEYHPGILEKRLVSRQGVVKTLTAVGAAAMGAAVAGRYAWSKL